MYRLVLIIYKIDKPVLTKILEETIDKEIIPSKSLIILDRCFYYTL